MSTNGEYLRVLTEGGSTSELPEPNSTNGKYLEYLVKGGDFSQLPQPNSVIGSYLYQLCQGGPTEKRLTGITALISTSTYAVGESIDEITDNITVTAHYSDATTSDVTSSAVFDTSEVVVSTAGDYTIGVSYTENNITKTDSVNITIASEIPDPVVPQTGTWQYKSTPTKGYIIIGKDDDTSDQAQFVRMVSGYGYPVTINTTYASKDNALVSDADTANSTYPVGSESAYPSGTTVETLNKHIIDAELGEVAQHDLSAKSIWDSTNIDDYMDGMYATYTAGGGTKTKAELKTAILEKYADTDFAQGANRIDEQRALLKASLEYPIYTLGEWGASGDTIVIDDINLGNLHDHMRSGSSLVAREKNYLADGILTHSNNSMPFKIYRNSEGLSDAASATSMCELALSELSAIECFCHLYIHNDSATDWNNLKSALDAIKSAVDAGKVEVVTRKQFAELGEYVEHPITALSFSPKELSYDVGTTLSASDFNCNAVLDDLSTVACASDKVVDLSQVNASTAGTYTATLYYRGKKQTCSVTISSEPTPDYILSNKSYSGASGSEGYNLASESLSIEAGKTYRFDFDFTAETSVRYSTHNIVLTASKQYGVEPIHWSANTTTITTTEGTTTAHVVVDMVADVTRTVAELFKWATLQNTTVGAWSITNLYCWEVTA